MRRVLVAAKTFFLEVVPVIFVRRVSLVVVAVGLVAAGPGAALAQATAPPVRSSIDENGVDLTSGRFRYSAREVSIGQPSAGGLTYERNFVGDGWRDNLTGTIKREQELVFDGWDSYNLEDTGYYIVSFGGASERFQLVSGVFVQAEGSQSTLSFDAGTQKYTYNNSGVVLIFDKALNTYAVANGVTVAGGAEHEGRITSITYPTGEAVTFHYKTSTSGGTAAINRLQSVTNNLGYHLKLTYARDAAPSSSAELAAWFQIASVTGINGAIDYCDPTADNCTYSVTWPTATYVVPASTNNLEVTDTLGRTTKYIQTGGASGKLITGLRRPTSPSTNNVTIIYDGSDRVYTISNGVGTWTYTYTDSADVFTTTKTDPLSKVWTYKSQSDTGLLLSVKDPLSRETAYAYDAKGRLIRVTRPEGDIDEYTYDARGNVTEVRRKAKPGSGLSDLFRTWQYPSSCTVAAVCNRPTSMTNELGATTDYDYESTGQLKNETGPPPTSGADRPQVRFSYTSLYAWYKNSAGTQTQASSPVSRVTGISACVTGSSCPATATERTATFSYGATGVANNLMPSSVSLASGDGAIVSATALVYDAKGDLTSEDGPLSGTADTISYRYDNGRQLVGKILPDPDGATTTLKHRAFRFSYDADGRESTVEQGTVLSRSDTDWAGFTVLFKTSNTYEASGRLSKQTIQGAAATLYGVSQYTYDAAGRLECAATRMNSATFTSPPSSACTLATLGADGPDRITKYSYDYADQVLALTEGWGTAVQADSVVASYTANGQLATVTNAKGFMSTVEYDGFDRPVKLRYPLPGAAGSSSTTDTEQYVYDSGSRIVQVTGRDGAVINIGFDALDRLISVDPPSGTADMAYTYNNLGNMLTATQSGYSLSMAYDALGRKTSETGPNGTLSYQYDAAGNRTRLTWPDGFYVTYVYDDAQDLKSIRQNGSTASTYNLGTFTYENSGNRKSISRANAAGTSHGFDAIGRMTTIVQNLPGTANDVTFSYTYNAGGQIKSRIINNSAFASATPSAVNRSYTVNGLDQLLAAGSLSVTYDALGNLTSDGVNNYSFDALGRITGIPSLVTVEYDPLDRMTEVAGASTTRFQYDGADLVAEYDASGTLLRRYVHGPQLDEPLVWFEGSGLTDRRWLISDDLGSVIAVTDGAGAVTAINKYDDYGVPESGNLGRFQYTGQAWIAELGLYNYKARAYSASLGRFLQTDPAGTADGLNLYAYVGNDPINWVDPYGLSATQPKNPSKPTTVDGLVITGSPYIGGMGRIGGLRGGGGGGGVRRGVFGDGVPTVSPLIVRADVTKKDEDAFKKYLEETFPGKFTTKELESIKWHFILDWSAYDKSVLFDMQEKIKNKKQSFGTMNPSQEKALRNIIGRMKDVGLRTRVINALDEAFRTGKIRRVR